MPLEPGTTLLNRYQIERLHKLGSHGAVYLANDLRRGFRTAVKENLIADPEYVQQFHIETRLLATLSHPYIPRATDYCEDETGVFMVMDWVEGENLSDWSAHDILPARDLVPMLDGAFQALRYLHSHAPPIIHRDVEPSNLILTPDGTVVLVDFGFAKIFDPSQQPSTTTDARSDQYSFAATIYYLLTRHIPVNALERAMGREQYIPSTLYDPAIPAHVEHALERAMALVPDDRYPDIGTFWEAIKKGF